MKVGDLVNYYIVGPKDQDKALRPSIILEIDSTHRQDSVTLLVPGGAVLKHVWIGYVEGLHETKSKGKK